MAAAEGTSHALVKDVENLSKGQDVCKETKLLMKPYVNWEEFLAPAPISIAILGELIFISRVQEPFPINTSPPAQGFQYLKRPDSFSASLCQVNDACWEAFKESERKMKQIKRLADAISKEMEITASRLFQEVEASIAWLPGKAQHIHKVTEQCGELANTVRAKFTDVINLIQELLEACRNAKLDHEKEREEVQKALEQAKIQEESAKEAKERAEQYHQQMKEQVEESFQQYKDALESIPTGWDAVGMELVTKLTQTLETIPVVFAKIRAGRKGNPGETGTVDNQEGLAGMVPFISASIICSRSSELLTFTASLKNLLDDHGDFKTDMILDEKTGEVKTEWVKKNLERLRNIIKKGEECEPKVKAQEICQAGLDICQQLGEMASSEGGIAKAERSLADRICRLYQEASEFDSYSKNYTWSPAIDPKLPNVSKMLKGIWAGEDNALLKAQQSRKDLEVTREEYQRSYKDLKKQNEELTNILCKIQSCQVKKVDFDTAMRLLIKLLEVLGNIKEQWEKMARFFQMIFNLIESCLVWSKKELADPVDGARGISKYSSKAFIVDVVYGYLLNASTMAQMVAMIFEMYTLVSEKYLTNCVSSLGRLFTMKTDHPQFAEERVTLAKRCEAAQRVMQDMVSKAAVEFESQLEAQAKANERERRAVMAANGEAHLRKLSLG